MRILTLSNQVALLAVASGLSLSVAVGQSLSFNASPPCATPSDPTCAPTGGQPLTFNASPAISSQATDWTASLGFPKFDPTLGSLQSVVLTLNGTLTGSIQIFNSGSSRRAVPPVLVSTVYTPTDSNLSGLEFTAITRARSRVLFPLETAVFGLVTHGGSSGSIAFTDASTLSEFTGTGTYSLELTTHTTFSVDPDLIATLANDASADGTVTYNYTAVPEQSAYAAFVGIGLLGFAARHRSHRNLRTAVGFEVHPSSFVKSGRTKFRLIF
jgi:hypothetical protein